MTKCVHCLTPTDKITKDHIFPKSWYPDNTPEEVQRWTIPACKRCNEELGKIEEDLFMRLGMCIPPDRIAGSGISKKVLESFGIGVALDSKEAAHRGAKLKQILAEMQPYSGRKESILPGLEPAEGHHPSNWREIPIPITLLRLQEKIVRGLEYRLGGLRYVGDDYEIETYNVYENSAAWVDDLISQGYMVDRGPGFQVARIMSPEQEVLYRIRIWDSFTIHASIMKKKP